MPSPQSQKIPFQSREESSWWAASPRKRENVLKNLHSPEQTCKVLIVDRDLMSSQLLATALTTRGKIEASGIRPADLLDRMASGEVHVVVIGADLNLEARNGFALAHTLQRAHPSISIVILLNQPTSDSVICAFRSGARGVFCRQRPVAEFVSCVEHVYRGSIWAGAQETTILLNAFSSMPFPGLLATGEPSLLTLRELQVVKCAARGKTNKAIAKELGLSEHTVKNYLFRAFEKLGVSNRVELLFYLTQKGQSLGASAADDPEIDLQAH